VIHLSESDFASGERWAAIVQELACLTATRLTRRFGMPVGIFGAAMAMGRFGRAPICFGPAAQLWASFVGSLQQ